MTLMKQNNVLSGVIAVVEVITLQGNAPPGYNCILFRQFVICCDQNFINWHVGDITVFHHFTTIRQRMHEDVQNDKSL